MRSIIVSQKIKHQIFKQLIFVIFCYQIPHNTLKADNVGIQAFIPSIHLIDTATEFGEKYSYKLDKKGRIVAMPGIKVFYDFSLEEPYFNSKFARLGVGYYLDCMKQKSWVFHLGLRWTSNLNERISFNWGLGPTLWLRESWNKFPYYEDNGLLQESDRFFKGYQYRFLVFGDFDLLYEIDTTTHLILSVVPAIPYIITSTFGIVWLI